MKTGLVLLAVPCLLAASGPDISTTGATVASCTYGAYRDPDTTHSSDSGCSGWTICEPGYYCDDWSRQPCAAGYYGNVPKLTTPECTGICPPGFYCPLGTHTPIKCPDAVSIYCPEGSVEPLPAVDGHYTVNTKGDETPLTLRTAIRPCGPGEFCVAGNRRPCPGGTFSSAALVGAGGCENTSLGGRCPAGFYCPAGSVRPLVCAGPTIFCPVGTDRPLRVHLGYYAAGADRSPAEDRAESERPCEPGFYCPPAADGSSSGRRVACEAGRWGDVAQETRAACSGECEAGYYCGPAAVLSRHRPCGSTALYCPAAAAAPVQVPQGFYSVGGSPTTRSGIALCPAGQYCVAGVPYACGEGLYGAASGLSDAACSGVCNEGFYCGRNNTSPTQYACGDASLYCPAGSGYPMPVSRGYYTVGGRLMPDQGRTMEVICPRGHYCVGGDKFECGSGIFGSLLGAYMANCSGPCDAGFFCPPKSVSRQERECGGADRFCPSGSAAPVPVTVGAYTVGSPALVPSETTTATAEGHDNAARATSEGALTRRSGERTCEAGFYCEAGIRHACPAGHFGRRNGTSDAACDGPCASGFWCPRQSTSRTQRKCGGPHLYCPAGSPEPLAVASGFYSLTADADTSASDMVLRSSADDCYRAENPPPQCARFSYRTWHFPLQTHVGGELVRARQRRCERGHWCSGGLRYECAPGIFGSAVAAADAECSGICEKGHYCPAASVSARHALCSAADEYCPAQSGSPTPVSTGYYTDKTHRQGEQLPCEPAHWCDGSGLKYPCPAGRYGDAPKLHTRSCSGLCASGHFCPLRSASRRQIPCGAAHSYCPLGSHVPTRASDGYFTTSGDADGSVDGGNATRSFQRVCVPGNFCVAGVQYKCPGGTFGAQSGLVHSRTHSELQRIERSVAQTAKLCSDRGDTESDTCGSDAADSESTVKVDDGDVWAMVFAGAAYEVCDGLCSPGYYCTAGATNGTEHECGGVDLFCPEGSARPRHVQRGYYTVGAQGENTDAAVKSAEVQCEPGHYCTGGLKYPCPAGSYGADPGLAGPLNRGYNRDGDGHYRCSGWCPSGHRCLAGTSDPMAPENTCAVGSYSRTGASVCTACPSRPDARRGDRDAIDVAKLAAGMGGQETRCTTSRQCCHY